MICKCALLWYFDEWLASCVCWRVFSMQESPRWAAILASILILYVRHAGHAVRHLTNKTNGHSTVLCFNIGCTCSNCTQCKVVSVQFQIGESDVFLSGTSPIRHSTAAFSGSTFGGSEAFFSPGSEAYSGGTGYVPTEVPSVTSAAFSSRTGYVPTEVPSEDETWI